MPSPYNYFMNILPSDSIVRVYEEAEHGINCLGTIEQLPDNFGFLAREPWHADKSGLGVILKDLHSAYRLLVDQWELKTRQTLIDSGSFTPKNP